MRDVDFACDARHTSDHLIYGVVRPFSWTDAPKRDESLIGFWTRISAQNWYTKTADSLRLTGREFVYPEGVAFADDDLLDRIAVVTRTDPQTLSKMVWSKRNTRLVYDGFQYPPLVASTRVRRVSPATLRSEPWHHASWDISVVSVCPLSGEMLLEECPVCQRPFGWKRALGPAHCDKCVDDRALPTVDLRDCPMRSADCDDLEGLKFAVGLVSTSPAIRRISYDSIPQSLAGLTSEQLTEMVIRLGNYAQHRSIGLATPIRTAGGDARRKASVHPQAIACAGRALLEWPHGLRHVLRGVDVSVTHVVRVAKGYREVPVDRELSRMSVDPMVASAIRSGLACHRLGDSGRARTRSGPVTGLVSQANAAAEFSMCVRTLRGLVNDGFINMTSSDETYGMRLFDRVSLESLRDERRDACSAYALSRRLGFPSMMVSALHEAGLVDRVSDAATSSIGAPSFSIRSVERLETTLRAKALFEKSDSSVSLRERLRQLPMRHRPWPSILTLMMSGKFAFGINPSSQKLADMFLVSTEVPLEDLVRDGSITPVPVPASGVTATFEEVWTTIRTRAENVGRLRAVGLLPEGNLSWGDLRSFLRRYVTLTEANERTSWQRGEGRNILARRGIHPVRSIIDNGGRFTLIYDRLQVGPFMTDWIDPDVQDV